MGASHGRIVIPCTWVAFGRRSSVVLWAAVMLAISPAALRGESLLSDVSNRVVIAILPFEDATDDPNLGPWRYMAAGLVKDQLASIKSLRIRSEEAAKYGLRKVGLSPGDAIDPNDARAVGEQIEAQRVVWGRCRNVAGQLHVEAWTLNVATNALSGPFIATGVDGFDLRDTLSEQILGALGIVPTEEERQKMAKRWTASSEALTRYGQGYLLQEQGRPVAEMEACFRKALAADPNCAKICACLAATLANQGQLGPAEDLARKAIELDRDDAFIRSLLGFILANQQRFGEAKEAARQACRLDRDDADPLVFLARLYALEGKWDEVTGFLEIAVFLEPTNAMAHASLASAHAAVKNRQAALRELQEADYFMPERVAALNVRMAMAETYERLGRPAEAIDHYTRGATAADRLGMNPGTSRAVRRRIRRLEGSLKPALIEATMPRHYSEQDLEAILAERLTETERQWVGNPFSCTEAMKQWARELTQDATSSVEKARGIWDGLMERTPVRGQARSRTAREVFVAWDDPAVRLVCMDHAVLFVALARAVDVNAFFVQVTRDPDGITMNHACAAIFDEDRALLADSSFRWFGVPHREYAILDDLQTAAFLCFNNRFGDAHPLVVCRAGLKLWPESIQGKLELAILLVRRDQPAEARRLLAELDQPASDGLEASMYWVGQSLLAEADGDLDQAEDLQRKAIAQCATQAAYHARLGNICLKRGRLAEARSAFRDCLRYNPDAMTAGFARQSIVQITEKTAQGQLSGAATSERATP